MGQFKAIILAGGFGTRLRPITCTRPKPLCEILGESVLERLLNKISSCQISETAISTMYMGETIQEQISKISYEMKIHFVTESSPLGSAGGAKYAAEGIGLNDEDTYIILSGDGIFDFDLNTIIQSHISKKADVTIVTVGEENPLEYGVILSRKDGRICSISEKPGWNEIKTDTVNTGIYIINGNIFKYIPQNRPFDFSKDLFPHLLGINKALYSYTAEGYWCDIGDLSAYYKCNIDALAGKILDLQIFDGMSREEILARQINCKMPCYISKSAIISQGAYIGEYSVIGKNVKIESGAEVNASIIFDNVFIDEGVKLTRCIICENTNLEKYSVVSGGCTIGAGANLKSGSIISDNVCIWPGKTVEQGYYITEDILFKDKDDKLYCDDGYFVGKIGEKINTEYISRLGSAITLAAGEKNKQQGIDRPPCLGVMHNGTSENALIADSILCGIKSIGGQSFSYIAGFESQAIYIASEFMTDYLLFITDIDSDRVIKIYDKYSFTPERSFERFVEAKLKSMENVISPKLFETIYIDNLKHLYFGIIKRKIENEFICINKNEKTLQGLSVCFESINHTSTENFVIKTIKELGAEIRNEFKSDVISIEISESGLDAVLKYKSKSGKEYFFDSYHIIAALISEKIKSENNTYYASQLFSTLYGNIFHALSFENSDLSNGLSYQNEKTKQLTAYERRWLKDMCYSVIKLMCIIKKSKHSLDHYFASLPMFEIKTRNVTTEDVGGEKRASVMKKLNEKYGSNNISSTDGITISLDDGNITVIPRKNGGFKLITNSTDAECSEELFVKIFDEIKNM